MPEWWDEEVSGSLKFIENRSWSPKLNPGDWVVIHVGQKDDSRTILSLLNKDFGASFPEKPWADEFTGKLIAAMRYERTVLSDEECPPDQLDWYDPGQHGWLFDLQIQFDKLIDGHKGKLSLTKLSPELEALVWEQINGYVTEESESIVD